MDDWTDPLIDKIVRVVREFEGLRAIAICDNRVAFMQDTFHELLSAMAIQSWSKQFLEHMPKIEGNRAIFHSDDDAMLFYMRFR